MQRKEFTKLRISAHQLQIELGRYTVPRKTPLCDRICRYCNMKELDNERHFVMTCPLNSTERQSLFSTLEIFTPFFTLQLDEQFIFLMSYNGGDMEILQHVLNFVNACVENRKNFEL